MPRYRKYTTGWALQIKRLVLRWNKQSNYTAFSIEYGSHKIV